MSDNANNETTEVSEKPVKESECALFPPFPEPTDQDFDEDITEEERDFYKTKFKDLNNITSLKLHCTACDRHLGCSVRNESRMRTHPMLRTLVCQTCHTFYNSGEFDKGEDGSELYCRWCGQGGQVYCCSDCCHVFCAKCIKRNLGVAKIREIEQLDDWKCFKCNNKCLWDLRALCWALLRYCDHKSKIVHLTEDPTLKATYQKLCSQDFSECCKSKFRRKEKDPKIKKETETPIKKQAEAVISKIPPTIQVKKFASIKIDDSPKPEKKAQKRPASPKKSIFIKNPIAISNKMVNNMNMQPVQKKIRMPQSPVINPVRFNNDRKIQTYTAFPSRIRPKAMQAMSPMSIIYNGYNPGTYTNDNINLSLESLTQGLDMSAMAGMVGNPSNDDVVCTPDFPLEPLCEVTEDNGDDDVQCITPGPVAAPKLPAPVLVRAASSLPDLSPENIVQMTDNDVTVNSSTGGLKFRVDPQTLSSNKMYRLPDGRIFAINANPNMPGGYSATIVAVTDSNAGKTPKGTTFAAKLSAVSSQSTPPPLAKCNSHGTRRTAHKKSTPKPSKISKVAEAREGTRVADMSVPVEWYRYNLIDAIDAMEYSLNRLHQLKKDATTLHLRTRTLPEMRNMHRALERSLNTSIFRFKEIRENLNKEFKQYLTKKANDNVSEDDDVEILHEDDDDPIFIDENSNESNVNESQDVDLTIAGSSDLNDSNERSGDKNDFSTMEDPLGDDHGSTFNGSNTPSNTAMMNKTRDEQPETEKNTVANSVDDVTTVDSKDNSEESNHNLEKELNESAIDLDKEPETDNIHFDKEMDSSTINLEKESETAIDLDKSSGTAIDLEKSSATTIDLDKGSETAINLESETAINLENELEMASFNLDKELETVSRNADKESEGAKDNTNVSPTESENKASDEYMSLVYGDGFLQNGETQNDTSKENPKEDEDVSKMTSQAETSDIMEQDDDLEDF